jgi:hypothetical protein
MLTKLSGTYRIATREILSRFKESRIVSKKTPAGGKVNADRRFIERYSRVPPR